MIKTRFAPSPTGYLHLGNARIALFNYLFALKNQLEGLDATFILRIEDTDQNRSQIQYVKSIISDLKWLGIIIDESQIVYQSERKELYTEVLRELQESCHIYPCFCTKERLEELKEQQIKQKNLPLTTENAQSSRPLK